jgi:hypothetical protein
MIKTILFSILLVYICILVSNIVFIIKNKYFFEGVFFVHNKKVDKLACYLLTSIWVFYHDVKL